MVAEHIDQMSGSTVILIELDEKRKKLIELLSQREVSSRFFYIAENLKVANEKAKELGISQFIKIMSNLLSKNGS